ncbi:hypothetical protein EYF80_066420 [Liparis tanakae]|uniref:Uncharacterized protein n=1 Tax=Liparis tanakae TaxID=230148 RepID=A0A4Z2E3W6_9TELE|nr:hypothetical protein EYF80_066420 [Liparis tanakae]
MVNRRGPAPVTRTALSETCRGSREPQRDESGGARLDPRAAMASNSLFGTVTPCQQNFFWGEYAAAARGLGSGSRSGVRNSRVWSPGRWRWIRLTAFWGLGDRVVGRLRI